MALELAGAGSWSEVDTLPAKTETIVRLNRMDGLHLIRQGHNRTALTRPYRSLRVTTAFLRVYLPSIYESFHAPQQQTSRYRSKRNVHQLRVQSTRKTYNPRSAG